MRSRDFAVAALVAVALTAALLAGRAIGPARAQFDTRLSTYLSGPAGAKGLAATLRRLGVAVEQRRRPLFDLGDSTARRPEMLVLLDIGYMTAREAEAVRQYIATGGRVFVAGRAAVTTCLAHEAQWLGESRWALDSARVRTPDPALRLPLAAWVVERLPPESLYVSKGEEGEFAETGCRPLFPSRVDTLLATEDGAPVAVDLRFRGGGRVTLMADAGWLTNRALKETDAGLVVLPWILAERPRRLTVDEYHQGYGARGSLFAAALRWLLTTPGGWATVQALAVGIVALAVAAVRFGVPASVIERRRRSPLEHVDALAAGLAGAGGVDAGVRLVVAGLRRRLSRGGHVPGGGSDVEPWLAQLEVALPTDRGRRAVRRLRDILNRPGGDERVLAAAQAVEDVWQDLHPRATRA